MCNFFFIRFLDSNELIAFKSYGLSNIELLRILALTSFVSGIIIISFFYNFASILKFKYIDLKNYYSNDSRYLASVTENGLWIKDENNNQIYIINAEKISLNKLHNVDLLVLEKDFSLNKNIFSEEVNITDKAWVMNNAKILEVDGAITKVGDYIFFSNFDYGVINNLYSNLSSLTIFDLFELRKDYKLINYSVTDLNIHIKTIFAYPFFLSIMAVFSSIIMMNVKHQKPKIVYLVGGIIFSVLIYYMNYFFSALGRNEQIPVLLSVWLPILLLSILSLIGMTRLNEK